MTKAIQLKDLKKFLNVPTDGVAPEDFKIIQEALLSSPHQVECPTRNYFADGQCVREMFMAAGLVVIGHIHKRSTVNILVEGKVLLYNGTNSKMQQVNAGHIYVSEPGVQKLAYVLEDATWLNCFPTKETEDKKILEEFTTPSLKEIE